MAVSKKPRKKQVGNWADRIATATISRIKAGLEEKQMFTYVGRLKGLNKGSYTRNKLTGLMNR